MRIVLDRLAWMEKAELTHPQLMAMENALTLEITKPPDYVEEGEDPTTILKMYEHGRNGREGWIGIPRQFFFDKTCRENELVDKMSDGHPISLEFKGKLDGDYAEQGEALEAFLGRLRGGSLGGVLKAAPAWGKTAWALSLAASLGRTTLVVVNREYLLNQWRERIEKFLPGAKVGVIRQDKQEIEGSDICLGLVQSLTCREYPEELYKWPGLVVYDEVHRVPAKTWSSVPPKFPARYRVGLSVGPDSVCEFRGGVFGDGWVGRIDDACSMAVDANGGRGTGISGIESRGWDGRGFCWKGVRSFLKHRSSGATRKIKVFGRELLLTDDHSVFVVDGCCRLEEKRAVDVVVGDTVLIDDGREWDSGCEADVDVLRAVGGVGGRCFVTVDLSGVRAADLGVDSGIFHNYKYQRGGESYLPASVFLENEDDLPAPTEVGLGGSSRVALKIRLSRWAYLLGYWLGKGWVNGGRVCWAVPEGRKDELLRAVADMPGVRWNPTVRKMRGASYEIRCSSSVMAALFKSIFGGVCAVTKKIPSEWIASWPREARMKLLMGLADSDWHLAVRDRGRKRIHYTTTSPGLVDSLLSLLRSLGIPGSFSKRRSSGGIVGGRRIQGRHPAYSVNWSWFAMQGMNDGRRGVRKSFDHGDFGFIEGVVQGVEKVDSPEFVYDLEMDGHPSFVANGILVHNSATPRRKDGADPVIWYHLGKILYSAKKDTLKPRLRRVFTGWLLPPVVRKNPIKMPTILRLMCANDGRNTQIAEQIVAAVRSPVKRKVMVLSDRVKHLVRLADRISDMVGDDEVSVDYYVGALEEEVEVEVEDKRTGKKRKKKKVRKKRRTMDELKQAERAQVIMATYQMAQEALDIPALDTVMLVTPRVDVEQAVGRIRRLCRPDQERCQHYCPWRAGECQGKPEPVIVTDFIDEEGECVDRAMKRMRFYEEIDAI